MIFSLILLTLYDKVYTNVTGFMLLRSLDSRSLSLVLFAKVTIVIFQ